MTKPARVAIIHPWLPQYRVPFFDLLVPHLEKQGVFVDIYYGDTPPEWADRNDSGTSNVCTRLPTRFFRFGGRSLGCKSIRPILDREPYDLIILEQAIRNLETFLLVAHPKTRHKIAFWGHGKNYTVARSGIEEKLKATLTNTGVWFFGYTQGGVDATVSSGYPEGQTTAVYNATDTSELRSQMASITEDELRQSRESLGLNGPTALYIGGLDEAKRIPFLLSAARIMREKVPNFSLIIAGAGSSQSTVEDFADKFAYIKYVGNTFGREKAKLFQIADILMVPGRVGLVAVESAAAGVPIVTTKWPLHAPEFEYLTPQTDCLVSEDDVESYARTASDLLRDKQTLSNLQDNCAELGKHLTIERMVEQFAHGVLSAVHMR